MSTTPPPPRDRLVTVPARHTLPLLRRLLPGLERIGRDCGGTLARLQLGAVRPYLATHPEHVRQVVTESGSFRREGMLWKEIRRLEGDGLAGEGAGWRRSRRMLQPLLSARSVTSYQASMAAGVAEALDLLAARAAGGAPVDLIDELTRIAHRVLIRVFFGDRITLAEADRLGVAISTALRTLGWRMVLPFVSGAVPLPGDRAFRRAVATIDRIVYPLIRAERECPTVAGPADFLVRFAHAVDDGGAPLTERRLRDDVVAMVVAGTETTAVTIAWLFLLLQRHPGTAERLAAEAAEVVGAGPAGPEHLSGLVHTRAALLETLRLFPAGWLIPRRVAHATDLAGVHLREGSTVLLSPLLTHRLTEFWDDPYGFRPERFTGRQWRRHRFAYLPFGAGAHQCLGEHFSLAEAQLVVAGLFSRFRPRLVGPSSLAARLAPVLQPRLRPRLCLSAGAGSAAT